MHIGDILSVEKLIIKGLLLIYKNFIRRIPIIYDIKYLYIIEKQRNKKKLDNRIFQGTRISNLKYKTNNQTSVKGVYPVKNGYRAIVWVQNEKIHLGTFDAI